MAALDYFNPKRTQPFIITLFMAIMAFKRVCKLMRMRMLLVKKRTHSHQLSLMQRQLKRSNRDVIEAARGRDVIQSTFIQNQIHAERNPQPTHTMSNEPKPIRKISTQKKVRRYLDDYAVKYRLGKGAPATVDRLVKALVIPDGPHGSHSHHQGGKSGPVRKSAMIMSALKATNEARASEIAKGPADRAGSPTAHHSNHGTHRSHHHGHRHQQGEGEDAKAIEEEEAAAGGPDDELGYEAGTHIYFGATVALQARHGGFLSYSSSAIRASAHKVLNNSRFIVKNSDDHTDCGVMRYGAALWLQAGHHDVLGAQYGSLIDQKREIQPALVSCKRASMFKAQQYGRWIVLNRAKPMETIGQPVLHEDKIILEQEWFFLASSSPYESHMYKTLNNSEEALTTKTELFNPGEECSWKMHLVALPSEDKAGELQRQLLLQQAKESLDDSAALRYEKAPSLLTSLHSKLPEELTDQAVFHGAMRRKTHAVENQEYLMAKYKELGAKNFHSNYNPTKFLSHVYGKDSNIVKYKTFVLQRNENDLTSPLFEHASQFVYDPSRYEHSAESKELAPRNPIELAEDAYWTNAQKVLVDSKSWVELHSSMTQYYREDRIKKVRAASVLQKWIRRFLMNSFNFERKMKQVDQQARHKLQEKLIARRKALIEHVSAMDAADHIDKASNLKFGASSTLSSVAAPQPSKPRHRHGGVNGSVSGVLSQSMSSIPPLSRSNTGLRSGSIDIHGAAHAAAAAAASVAATGALNSAAPVVGNATGPLPYSADDRRRSKSLTPAQRSKSLAQLSDISQIVGPAAMAAIFNAAGLVPAVLAVQESGSAAGAPRLGRSQSMIFQHTAVDTVEEGDGEGSPITPSSPTGGSGRRCGQRATLMALHAQARSMPSLPTMSEGRASFSLPGSAFVQRIGGGGGSVVGGGGGGSSKHRSGSFAEQCEAERIEKRNAFTAMLGFEVPGTVTSPSNSAKKKHGRRLAASNSSGVVPDEQAGDHASPVSPQSSPPTSPGPYAEPPGDGIAYHGAASPVQPEGKAVTLPGASEDGTPQKQRHHKELRHGQRPYTANAALRNAPSMAEELEREARRRERELHEAHKAAQKELQRAQARQERKRLGRTAENEFGLPKDMFRDTHADCSAVIGLKFLRAVSKNPKIYDDVKLKKRPSSSAGHRSPHHSGGAVRGPGSNMW